MKNQWVLIINFLKGQLSNKEKELLKDWLDEDKKNREKFEEAKEIWKLTKPSGHPVYDLDDEKQKILDKIKSLEKVPVAHIRLTNFSTSSFLKVAAVILLIVAASFITWMFSTSDTSINESRQVLVSREGVTRINLPDGSLVDLNEESKISYSQSPTRRMVNLQGEAFFEVKKDNQPFVISVQQILIKVKGTSFNVKTTEDGEVKVTVVSGKVEVADGHNLVSLTAGQTAVAHSSGKEIETSMTENPNFLAWKTQQLVFKDTKLNDVIYTLSEYYDVTFKIKTPEILDCRFTGTFEKARLETVMEVLAYSLGFEYYYEKEEYILSGKKCR